MLCDNSNTGGKGEFDLPRPSPTSISLGSNYNATKLYAYMSDSNIYVF